MHRRYLKLALLSKMVYGWWSWQVKPTTSPREQAHYIFSVNLPTYSLGKRKTVSPYQVNLSLLNLVGFSESNQGTFPLYCLFGIYLFIALFCFFLFLEVATGGVLTLLPRGNSTASRFVVFLGSYSLGFLLPRRASSFFLVLPLMEFFQSRSKILDC